MLAVLPFTIGFVNSWLAGLGFLLVMLGLPILVALLLIWGIVYVVRGIKAARLHTTIPRHAADALVAPAMIAVGIVTG